MKEIKLRMVKGYNIGYCRTEDDVLYQSSDNLTFTDEDDCRAYEFSKFYTGKCLIVGDRNFPIVHIKSDDDFKKIADIFFDVDSYTLHSEFEKEDDYYFYSVPFSEWDTNVRDVYLKKLGISTVKVSLNDVAGYVY